MHVLSRGQIVHSGTPAELMTNDDVKTRYLGVGLMRFGTYFFLQAPPGQRHADIIARELDQMVWSEELGFDEVWLTEHHFIDYGLSVDPASPGRRGRLAHVSRIRIGLAAAILPFHDPIRLAEEMALVDISRAAAGSTSAWAAATGRRSSSGYRVPQMESRERFEEALADHGQRAWTEERFPSTGATSRSPRSA